MQPCLVGFNAKTQDVYIFKEKKITIEYVPREEPESSAGEGAPDDVPQADDELDGGGESVESEQAMVDSSDMPEVKSVPGGSGGN